MGRPTLSVICPTVGRDTLARTLQSIRCQADAATVEVICVGDTYGDTFAAALAPVPALCAQYAARYVEHDGGIHCVGQPQRQRGSELAAGDWLMWSQDDSILTPGAVAAIQAAIAAGPVCPIIAQVDTHCAGVVWRTPRLALGNLDADGLIFPNRPERLGAWALSYNGDWEMARDTVTRWRGQVRWMPQVIAIARPERLGRAS